jgi:hypothetical protein
MTNPTAENDPRLNLKEVLKEGGVADLPNIKIRGYFAKAVIAERQGNHSEAESNLDKAVAEEIIYLNR